MSTFASSVVASGADVIGVNGKPCSVRGFFSQRSSLLISYR